MQDYLLLGLISAIAPIGLFILAGMLTGFRLIHVFFISAGIIAIGFYLAVILPGYFSYLAEGKTMPKHIFYEPAIIGISIGFGLFFALLIVSAAHYMGGVKRR